MITTTTIMMSPSSFASTTTTSSSSFGRIPAAADVTTRVLRALHHKHSAKAAAHARVVRLHTKTQPKLLKLQQEIER
jgi:hypothetical protein